MDNMNCGVQSGDMEILNDNGDSEVRKFYAGKNILLTGCTGFLGTLILEKLLRTCTEISKIYIIVRTKRGISPEERIKLYFENIVFNELRKKNPNFMENVVLIQGNLGESSLGICANDRRRLVENVNIIIHNAAMVQFKPKASVILRTNVVATQKLLEIATECSHLEAFVYISTAYSNPYVKYVEEQCYPPPADLKFVQDIIRADEENASGIRDEALDDILKTYFNLYAFSKATTEGVVQDYSRTASFPCIIYRPSMVTVPYHEPTKSWLANMNGFTGPIALTFLGLLHFAPLRANVITDNVPCDLAINYLLALIWDHVAHRKSCKLEVYNYGSSDWNPHTQKIGRRAMLLAAHKCPSRNMVWYPTMTYIPNYHVFLVIHTLLTIIPAAIYDLTRIVTKKQTKALSMAWIKNKHIKLLYPYTIFSWIIKSDKAQNLLNRMNAADVKEFNFDLSIVDWYEVQNLINRGVRVLLKETPDDLILARKKYRNLQILHYTVCSLFVFFCMFLLYKIVCICFCY